jgi:hypothetical protein
VKAGTTDPAPSASYGIPEEDLSRPMLPMQHWDRFRYLMITAGGGVQPLNPDGDHSGPIALDSVLGAWFQPSKLYTCDILVANLPLNWVNVCAATSRTVGWAPGSCRKRWR